MSPAEDARAADVTAAFRMNARERAARADIRRVIDDWAIARDGGDWSRLRSLWHAGGTMAATMFQGPAEAFIDLSRRGFERGVEVVHFLGASSIDVTGRRAVAQTRMTISQRGDVHGVECDVACTGRFFDFFAFRERRWALVRRQPIYERDRIDTVDPGARLQLDPALLDRFPRGYRHLGYLQTLAGLAVKDDMPGLRGPIVEALMRSGTEWLAGGDSDAALSQPTFPLGDYGNVFRASEPSANALPRRGNGGTGGRLP